MLLPFIKEVNCIPIYLSPDGHSPEFTVIIHISNNICTIINTAHSKFYMNFNLDFVLVFHIIVFWERYVTLTADRALQVINITEYPLFQSVWWRHREERYCGDLSCPYLTVAARCARFLVGDECRLAGKSDRSSLSSYPLHSAALPSLPRAKYIMIIHRRSRQ